MKAAFKVNAAKAAKQLTVHVRVTGMRRVRVRLWLGARIIRFGAWVMGTRSEISVDR